MLGVIGVMSVVFFGRHLYDKMTTSPAKMEVIQESTNTLERAVAPGQPIITAVITESTLFEIPVEGWWVCGYDGRCQLYNTSGTEEDGSSEAYDFDLKKWVEAHKIYINPKYKAKAVTKITILTGYDRAEEVHKFFAFKNEYFCEEYQNRLTGPSYDENKRWKDISACTDVTLGEN